MMQGRQAAFPDVELPSPTGLFLITEDELGVGGYLAELLQAKGAQTRIISKEDLQQRELLVEIAKRPEPVRGIVHLAALGPLTMPENLSDWRSHTSWHVKSMFQLLQLSSPTKVLAASLLGGNFGRNSNTGLSGLVTGGMSNGLLKTLMVERPAVEAKAVDFDHELDAKTIAKRIYQELMLPGGRVEVGYPQGTRTVFQTVPAPGEKTQTELTPGADWVVLVTGGARGITAEIAKDLAAYGITMIVVGRSPYPREESPETAGRLDVASLRKVLLQQARKQGLSSTPVQIERQIWGIRRDRAIRRNLKSFQEAGAQVEYRAADVTNESEFGNLIDEIYGKYDRLDAVIHGAGIIEDKLIADKTPASFDRVFDTKVDSAFIIGRHLRPESLKLLVFFSSVAGRYGNRGQADYAAANEIVNRLAWHLQGKWENTRVVAINWGPWDSTGMASAEVKRKFREQGVIPIPLEAGRQFFIDEVLYGKKGETEIIAGDGPWEAREAEMGVLKTTSTTRAPLLATGTGGRPELGTERGEVTLEHTFSTARDPYLLDHCLDGKPVVPATVALEWIAQFVQAAWPEWTVSEVRDLRVLRGLMLSDPGASRKLLLKARASSHADAEMLQVTAQILDPDSKISFYRASAILSPQLESPPAIELLPLTKGTGLEVTTAYRDYLFHGPSFHLIKSIHTLTDRGIDAQALPSQPSLWLNGRNQTQGSWLFDPGLLDTAPQMAIVWARRQWGTTALPSRLGKVVRYGRSPIEGPLQIAFRVQPGSHNPTLLYDAVFLDSRGQVRWQLVDVESTCNAALNRLANQEANL